MGRVPLRTGDAVRIRGERWQIAGESAFESVSIIDADGCDATNRGIRARFILPFEPIAGVAPRPSTPRLVTLARWRRAARAMLANAVPHWSSLRAAARARLTVLPFQLEPAIAVTRGEACRVLIADEVGLGKTIQASLIIAETIERTADARVLIVAPAGLKEQWRSELESRFELSAEVLDAEGVARTVAHLLPDTNPWSVHPLAITSIDYVKRPEVMRSLEALTWDVLVFDEAHALAGFSDRATAAAALARRARVLVMLTATPHSGDDEAFTRLCALGDIDGGFPLKTFHRTRADVGVPRTRRSTQLRIALTRDEIAMHRTLDQYIARLADEPGTGHSASALLGAILTRRACSSAFSLAQSIERRSALVLGGTPATNSQLTLPFCEGDSDEAPGDELGVPGLRDPREEAPWLLRLAELARHASASEGKFRLLSRLVRRAREPVLIFTEYRDTLRHLAAALSRFAPLELHGGLTPRERLDTLRRFTSGAAMLLLATDAASEGLNLHHRCRLVVNLELPWTPARLEQRIGRVDRLGQPRRVHAVQLIATGTKEEAIAARLAERTARIRTAMEAPGSNASGATQWALTEAARILTAKSLFTEDSPAQDGAPFITCVRGNRSPSRIWVFRLSCVDDSGHVVFETVAGVGDECDRCSTDPVLRQIATRHHANLLTTESVVIAAWLHLAGRREAAIADALRESHARLSASLLQPRLFDRRAERAAAAQASRVDEALQKSAARLSTLARVRLLRVDEPSHVFGIVFRA